jgi:hypothetical protein
MYQAPVYTFPFIFGTTSNVILLIIIISNKDMRPIPNMYIINLAISYITYFMVLFSEACANRISDTWLDCKFMGTFLSFCRCLSMYSADVLSNKRYRVTVNPSHVHVSSPPTWRSNVATICGIWIVATLFAVPSAISNYLGFDSHPSRNIPYYKRVVIF